MLEKTKKKKIMKILIKEKKKRCVQEKEIIKTSYTLLKIENVSVKKKK